MRRKSLPCTGYRGVSPVVGVILMVAITVILAAVIGAFALDLGNMGSPSVNAGVSIDEGEHGETTILVTDDGNADELLVRYEDGTETPVSVGTALSAPIGQSITVVGVKDGHEVALNSHNSGTDVVYSEGYSPKTEWELQVARPEDEAYEDHYTSEIREDYMYLEADAYDRSTTVRMITADDVSVDSEKRLHVVVELEKEHRSESGNYGEVQVRGGSIESLDYSLDQIDDTWTREFVTDVSSDSETDIRVGLNAHSSNEGHYKLKIKAVYFE